MPIYCYACPSCGRRQELVRPSTEREAPVACDCGGQARRDLRSELPNANGTQKGDTFWSDSLAINPEQAAEHRRLFPDVQIDREGRLGFDTVKGRSDYLDKCGFDKPQQRQKRRETKLPTPVLNSGQLSGA